MELHLKVRVSRIDELRYYISRIDDMDEEHIYIPVPYSRMLPLKLAIGDRVIVKYAGETESFMFETVVTGVRREKIILYQLKKPANIQREQQRDFCRVPVLLEVFCVHEPRERKALEFKRATALDLSAGGLKLATEETWSVGDHVLVKINFPDTTAKGNVYGVTLKSEVVRINTMEASEGVIYHVGLKFLDVGRSEQDRIVNYVFTRMTKMGRYS